MVTGEAMGGTQTEVSTHRASVPSLLGSAVYSFNRRKDETLGAVRLFSAALLTTPGGGGRRAAGR